MLSKLINFVKVHLDDIILLIGVILISLLSFAMGYITAKQQEKEPIRIERTNGKFLISNKIPNVKIGILLGIRI
ncbi:MAG: hypothetical protein Q7K28_02100 [Candidatus Wildermuthbacteria bacterium]|nr:hypothetical protein [Candidatus Wildermuthbacteria bacterium]